MGKASLFFSNSGAVHQWPPPLSEDTTEASAALFKRLLQPSSDSVDGTGDITKSGASTSKAIISSRGEQEASAPTKKGLLHENPVKMLLHDNPTKFLKRYFGHFFPHLMSSGRLTHATVRQGDATAPDSTTKGQNDTDDTDHADAAMQFPRPGFLVEVACFRRGGTEGQMFETASGSDGTGEAAPEQETVEEIEKSAVPRLRCEGPRHRPSPKILAVFTSDQDTPTKSVEDGGAFGEPRKTSSSQSRTEPPDARASASSGVSKNTSIRLFGFCDLSRESAGNQDKFFTKYKACFDDVQAAPSSKLYHGGSITGSSKADEYRERSCYAAVATCEAKHRFHSLYLRENAPASNNNEVRTEQENAHHEDASQATKPRPPTIVSASSNKYPDHNIQTARRYTEPCPGFLHPHDGTVYKQPIDLRSFFDPEEFPVVVEQSTGKKYFLRKVKKTVASASTESGGTQAQEAATNLGDEEPKNTAPDKRGDKSTGTIAGEHAAASSSDPDKPTFLVTVGSSNASRELDDPGPGSEDMQPRTFFALRSSKSMGSTAADTVPHASSTSTNEGNSSEPASTAPDRPSNAPSAAAPDNSDLTASPTASSGPPAATDEPHRWHECTNCQEDAAPENAGCASCLVAAGDVRRLWPPLPSNSTHIQMKEAHWKELVLEPIAPENTTNPDGSPGTALARVLCHGSNLDTTCTTEMETSGDLSGAMD
ncbi:unnamed protein product [Amoebophrya sp. A25]|nr:unnamed protein product [Amoebophrya sp. A25]|eukprot:GSA25T00011711001.1